MAEPSDRPAVVAYVLKGYPRISELFIASEIWRLEQLGVPLRLYVCKPRDEGLHHEVVDRIAAQPRYLPETTSLGSSTVHRWLRDNVGPFRGAMRRAVRRHPIGVARSIASALAQSFRARTGIRPKSIYLKEWLLAVALVDELDRAGDVTHLHAHFAHGTTTVAWLASRMTGMPFSFTGHAKDIYRESLNPAGLLDRKAAAAEFVLTCTRANLEHLRSVAPAGDVHLAYHGLNADFERLLADAPPARAPEHMRIVSVGRMVPKKGFDVLLAAVAQLKGRGVVVELAIAGESGSERDRLVHQIAELGLADDVDLVGTCSQRELLAIYRNSSVFALACRVDDDGDRDGIPNVLVEAMASGLPVVSTRVSGIPELVVDGENGLLVEPEDPSALADALLRIAKDPDLSASLSAAGRQSIRDHFDGDLLARDLASRFRAARFRAPRFRPARFSSAGTSTR